MIYGDVDGKFHCNTIFIQPTNACCRGCTGCYVKAHQHGPQLDPEHHIRFQRLLWWGERILCNQMTISMDSKGYAKQFGPNNQLLDHMARFALPVGMVPNNPNPDKRPELHLTFNTVSDFRFYDWAPRHNSGIDVISFSHIAPVDFAHIDKWFCR